MWSQARNRRTIKSKPLGAIAVALIFLSPSVYAARNQIVQGTVITVKKNRVQSPEYTVGGSNPADAPLTSTYYSFEVSVRVNCEIYIGRYSTPFNYLPSMFSSDRVIPLRLTRHVMYFDTPNDPELRMGIIRRSSACGSNR
jgi:hypothetical protein